MDAPTTSSISATDQISVLQGSGFAFATLELINSSPNSQIVMLQNLIASLSSRILSLESKAEEVSHFTGSAKLPAIAALSSGSLVISPLIPSKSGDVLKVGEPVLITCNSALPSGFNISTSFASSENTVTIQFTALVSVSASTNPITWNVSVLR